MGDFVQCYARLKILDQKHIGSINLEIIFMNGINFLI